MASETNTYIELVYRAIVRCKETQPVALGFKADTVAREAGISFGTAHAYLKRLVKEGRVESWKESHATFFAPNIPNPLLDEEMDMPGIDYDE